MSNRLSRVCKLFQSANERVIIISAYIGQRTLSQLLDAVPKGIPSITVFTRWDIQDILSGATDWEVWDVSRQHDVTLYSCPRLHVKLYVSDNQALVGSANATASGLGLDGPGNIELLIDRDATDPEILKILSEIELESTEAIPVGIDMTEIQKADGSKTTSLWLPEIDLTEFLEILHGRASHTVAFERTCALLGLGITDSSRDDAVIRNAVRSTTSFRLVKHEFDTRVLPMSVPQLQELLAKKINSDLSKIPIERINNLIRWLGYFGQNTHLESNGDSPYDLLYPGQRITTYRFQSKNS